MENWKPITEFSGVYEVSDHGRVRRAIGGRGTRAGRHTKIVIDAYGYSTAMLSIKCKKHLRKVHRLVAIEFIPNSDSLPEINHQDGNKQNNVPDNLEWCLHCDNQKHASETGLMASGARNGTAKLTAESVLAIRKADKSGVSLASQYGVSSATISLVKNRKSWKRI